MIAGRLTAEGIKTPTGKDNWYQSTVVSILENEKYCGDLLMGKWYVQDFLTHKIVRNQGELPQYFVEDHHPPIVPKEIFYQVQGEMQRRSLLKYDPSKIRFGSSEVLKGRLYCGLCGRVLKKYKSPTETTWRCRRRAYKKQSVSKEVESSCKLRNAPEREVKKAILMAFNSLPWKRDELVRLQGGIWNGEIKRIDVQIESVKEQQRRLGERLDTLVIDEDNTAVSRDEGDVDEGAGEGGEATFLRGELETLEMEYTRLVLERAEAANREVQIRVLLELVDAMRRMAGAHIPTRESPSEAGSAACSDYDEFFKRTSCVIDESVIGDDGKIMSFSNDMVLRYLDRVVVNEKNYEVLFKAGVSITIPLE